MADISDAAKNAAIDAVAAFAYLPGANGTVPYIAWRSGGSTLARTRLSSSTPTWNAASGGSASLVVAPFDMVSFSTLTSGTIDSASLFNGNTNSVMTITVGAAGSGAELELTGSFNYVAGQQFRIDQFDLFIA